MEVLEIAKVDMFSNGNIVLPAHLRPYYLCVVWEGTLAEKLRQGSQNYTLETFEPAVWYAGDWTGPISIQPHKNLSSESRPESEACDIIAASEAGVKVRHIDCLCCTHAMP